MNKLKDRIALSRARRGIGRAITERMTGEGARVIVSNLDAVNIAYDVLEPVQIETLFAPIDGRFGRLDILVYSAGGGAAR